MKGCGCSVRIFTTENQNSISIPNTTPISHVMYENLIFNEKLYRDTVLELYQALYPAHKYKDTDILTESIGLSLDVMINFFKMHKNNMSLQYSKTIAKLRTMVSEYKEKCKCTDNTKYTPRLIRYSRYVFTDRIPNLAPLKVAADNIKLDHERMTTSNNVCDYATELMKSLEDINDDNEDYITLKLNVKASLRGNGEKLEVMLSDRFLDMLKSYDAKFNIMIKAMSNKVNEYLKYIDKVLNNLCKCAYVEDKNISIDLVNIDPQNTFYKYELNKFSHMFNVIDKVLYEMFIMIEEHIQEYTELLDCYSM